MIIAAILLQATPANQLSQQLADGLKKQEAVLDRVFDCMDRSTKGELKSRISSATAENVTDAAIKLCKPALDEFEKSTEATFLSSMPPEKAKVEAAALVFGQTKRLREVYVSHLDKSLIDPALADSRMKIVSIEWGQCVREKAERWAALKDEARTVAEAAVTSCDQARRNIRLAIGYVVRAKGWPADSGKELEDSLLKSMNASAVGWVIEKRGSALQN